MPGTQSQPGWTGGAGGRQMRKKTDGKLPEWGLNSEPTGCELKTHSHHTHTHTYTHKSLNLRGRHSVHLFVACAVLLLVCVNFLSTTFQKVPFQLGITIFSSLEEKNNNNRNGRVPGLDK